MYRSFGFVFNHSKENAYIIVRINHWHCRCRCPLPLQIPIHPSVEKDKEIKSINTYDLS